MSVYSEIPLCVRMLRFHVQSKQLQKLQSGRTMKDHHYILTSNSSVNKPHLPVEQRHNQTQTAIPHKNNMPLQSP